MLATQLNPLITENTVKKNSIVVLKKFLINHLNGKKVAIILGMDVLVADAGRVIGSSIVPRYCYPCLTGPGNPQSLDANDGNDGPQNTTAAAAPRRLVNQAFSY